MTAPIDTFRGRFLPYCIEPLPDGRYIVLNRNYKPLGESSGWVEYETHPSSSAANWEAYAARVQALAELELG